MSSHVLQQPLLLLPNSAAAHLIQPLQDLQRRAREGGGQRLEEKASNEEKEIIFLIDPFDTNRHQEKYRLANMSKLFLN